MVYLLDANVFMSASRLHYNFDFCPAFWDWLANANKQSKVFSIERIETELKVGNDNLAKWATKTNNFFLKPDTSFISAFSQVSTWATSKNYEQAAINTFLGIADSYLVAHALAKKWIVVTHEVASPSTKKIKIPDACLGVGVPHVTPFEMLRKEQARFIL